MNVKLNLDFSLYKGVTKLKQWYKEVKAHFIKVQEAHNALEDTVEAESGKLSTEITQRTNADIALSDRINAEANTRSSADTALGQRITTEAKKREKADSDLQVRIDEIGQSSGTSALFGDELTTHTVKFVAPENKPTLYWDGDQEYYGNSISVDIVLTNAFYIDGKQINGTFHEWCINVPCDEGIYIVVQYNFADNTCDIKPSTNAVASTISGNVWTFTLYHYYNIRLDFKIDSGSPTGDRFVFEGCVTDYIEPNEDATENTYTITNTYERLRTLDNLNTENKNSFLDAVNENAEKITTETITRETADNALDGRVRIVEDDIAANEARIDAITLEIVDDNYIGNYGGTEVMLPGKILQLNNRDDFSVSTELKIRCEINYENPYPDAKYAEFSTDLNTTDIYWTYVSAGQTGGNFGGDAYYYVFDTEITKSGKMYFQAISLAHAGADITYGTIKVLAVVQSTPTTAAYIRTCETEDWTRLITEREFNASKSDITALQQQVNTLDSTLAILRDNLGTMSDMLDLLNGVTEEST